MKARYHLLFAVMPLLMVSACKKSNTPAPAKTTSVDVYIAGSTETTDISLSQNSIAAYWKNGIITKVSDSTINAGAYAITVVGTDIYVAGYISTSLTSNHIAVYWKNGVMTKLTDGSTFAYANSIAVQGANVYVGGMVTNGSNKYVATLWKNNTPTNLGDGTTDSFLGAIAVSGTDVYVAGTDKGTAMLWKNGVGTQLATGQPSGANALTIVGSDVYVAGGISSSPVYWKNGVATHLFIPQDNLQILGISVTGIAVSGYDVYVSGFTNDSGGDNAVIWKNGEAFTLSSTNSVNNVTTGIAVSGDNVYVSGDLYVTAGYWRNGAAIQLPSVYGSAQGITLVSH